MAHPATIRLTGPIARASVVPAPSQAGRKDEPLTPQQLQARQLQQQAQQFSAQKQQSAQALTALEAAADGVQQLRAQILQQAQTQLLDLALEIASKVLAQQVQAGAYEAAPIVQAALEHLPPHTEVTVKLNPKDLEQIQSSQGGAALGGHVTLVADASINPAECLVQADQGSVQSTIQGGLDEAAAAMKGQT
jgi:flagellar assembly protein FliH